MKKRILTLVLITVLALTGCSSKPATQTTDRTPAKTSDVPKEDTTSDNRLSDTLLWFNATYAVITTKNNGDVTLVGGYNSSDTISIMMQQGLESSWDVTDKTSADETLKWLTEEGGHNSVLLGTYNDNELSSFTRDELVDALTDESYTDLDRVYFLGIYDAVEKYGDNAIKAWDLSRAMQLSSWYYLAGYYTYEEAMDASLDIAQELQKTYTSWDDMMESYLYGFQYWNEDDIADETSESYTRSQIYQELKNQKDSLYSIDWNSSLTKEWE